MTQVPLILFPKILLISSSLVADSPCLFCYHLRIEPAARAGCRQQGRNWPGWLFANQSAVPRNRGLLRRHSFLENLILTLQPARVSGPKAVPTSQPARHPSRGRRATDPPSGSTPSHVANRAPASHVGPGLFPVRPRRGRGAAKPPAGGAALSVAPCAPLHRLAAPHPLPSIDRRRVRVVARSPPITSQHFRPRRTVRSIPRHPPPLAINASGHAKP